MKTSLCASMLLGSLYLGLTPPLAAAVLSVDDGTAENSVGITNGGSILVLNRFTTTNGTVTDVRIDWSQIANGTLFSIGIWSDPDLNGNPSDATLLQSLTGQSVTNANYSYPHAGFFNIYDVIDTPVTDSFFVGFSITNLLNEYPASLDATSSQASSWAAIGGFGAIGSAGLIASFGLPGNWLIQANVEPSTSAIPEPVSAMATFVFLMSGMLVRRRAVA